MSLIDDQITAAEAALQNLMTGALRQSIEYEGRRVTFFQPDVQKLREYIEELKQRRDGRNRRGAIGVVF